MLPQHNNIMVGFTCDDPRRKDITRNKKEHK